MSGDFAMLPLWINLGTECFCMKFKFACKGWRVYMEWNVLRLVPDDVFRHHVWRLVSNIVLLLLLVFHRNAAFLKKYLAVTELSPGRLLYLLVVLQVAVELCILYPIQRRHSVSNISDYITQWELITIRKFQMNEPSYWVTAHLSVNFIPVFSTEPSLHKAKEQKQPTNLLENSCTQKSLLLPFQQIIIIISETNALSQNLFSRNA